jgi:tRNA G26 N,N-dimethylase Trm1
MKPVAQWLVEMQSQSRITSNGLRRIVEAIQRDAEKSSFAAAANYVHWARHEFKTLSEIEDRFRELSEKSPAERYP